MKKILLSITIFGLCLTVISLLMVRIETYSGDGVKISSTGIDQIRFVAASAAEAEKQEQVQVQFSNNHLLDTPIENNNTNVVFNEMTSIR